MPAKHICPCGKPSLKGRKICAACSQRRYRKKNPFRAAYIALRDNAKRRGKLFDLSFEEFKQFATATEYWQRKGKRSTSLHIDRIKEDGPYSLTNIQPLENAANVKKYFRFKQRNETGIAEFEVITAKPVLNNNCPF